MTTRQATMPPRLAWQRLAYMQHVVSTRPEIAYAVRCLALLDQLELTVDLLTDGNAAELELPPNAIRFRPRRSRPLSATFHPVWTVRAHAR